MLARVYGLAALGSGSSVVLLYGLGSLLGAALAGLAGGA